MYQIGIPIIAFIILLFYNFPVKKISYIDSNKLKNQCKIPHLDRDKCFQQEYNHCPMGSYKQCTNNYKHQLKCHCKNRSFEMCSPEDKISEECYYSAYFNQPNKLKYPNYPKNYPRVNLYKSQLSKYDFTI